MADGTSRAPFSTPTFARLWQDPGNRLWAVIKVPDAEQEKARAAVGQHQRLDHLDWDAVQDTRIEVIDPVSGRLLATRRFEQVLVLLNNGFVAQRRQTPEGLVQVVISTLSLRTNQD